MAPLRRRHSVAVDFLPATPTSPRCPTSYCAPYQSEAKTRPITRCTAPPTDQRFACSAQRSTARHPQDAGRTQAGAAFAKYRSNQEKQTQVMSWAAFAKIARGPRLRIVHSLPGLTHPHSIRLETHCSTTDSRANDWPRSWARYPRGRRAAGNLAVVKPMTANSPSA
jgi:hypothetical protein